jgi:hypothetical protein
MMQAMLQLAQILVASPMANRRAQLHELRSRLGQAALTTAPDTRSLLEKRWAWLERQYASRPEVLGWLDTVFAPRFPNMRGEYGSGMHKDDPLFCQALAWLARSAARYGLPTKDSLVDQAVHDWIVNGGYEEYAEGYPGDATPDAIYNAAEVAATENEYVDGQPFDQRQPPSWYRENSHTWCSNNLVDLSRFSVSWPYVPFQPGVRPVKAAKLSRPVVTGKLLFGTPEGEEPLIEVRTWEALKTTFNFYDVPIFVHDPHNHVPRELSIGATPVPVKALAGVDPAHPTWYAGNFIYIAERVGVSKYRGTPSPQQAKVRALLDEVCKALTVYLDEVAWICGPTQWFVTEQLLDFLRAHPNYSLGNRRIDDVVDEVITWHGEAFIATKDPDQEEITVKEGEDLTTAVSFADGARIVEILTSAGLAWEGAYMHHCVGRDDVGHPRLLERGQVRIFSYRDPEDRPLATVEVENDSDTFPAWQTRDLQGPHNGPIATLEARVRLGTFLFELRERRLSSDDWKHVPLYIAIDELIDSRRIDKNEVMLHAWDLYWSVSTVTVGKQDPDKCAFPRGPLTIPKIPASLELRCADDRGRSVHPSDNVEDDKNCIEDYEQTVEGYLKLNEDRTLPAVVDIIPSDDRDSRHTDCYLRFDLPDIAKVAERIQAAGASGDILDVDGEIFPFLKVWIEHTFGW